MSLDDKKMSLMDTEETTPLQTLEVNDRKYGTNSNETSPNSNVQYLNEPETENFEERKSSRYTSIPWQIYLSRALSAWGDRIWDFSLGIFMNLLNPESLRLAAIQGLVVNISVILFGSAIGNWIDRNKRLLAARIFLSIQNTTVAISCGILVLHFVYLYDKDIPKWIIPTIVILVANFGNLASVGQKIVVEKDWIVVVAGDDDERLASMNAVFRTIDLTALVLSPSFAGLFFDFTSSAVTAAILGCWNLVSVIIEYIMLKIIYNKFPELGNEKRIDESMRRTEADFPQNSCCRWFADVSHGVKIALHGWKIYFTHPVCAAGLALASVYMTVLGFDNITYGFCMSQCVTESILGGLVGVSAIIGIFGSLAFPLLRRKVGLHKTGLIGFASLIGTLTLCVVSIWLPGSPFDPLYFTRKDITVNVPISMDNTSIMNLVPSNASYQNQSNTIESDVSTCYVSSYISVSVLLSGIILHRFGLWISDLTITQTLQEKVEEQHRGVINGVQNSANSVMDVIKFALVIGLPDNETFGYLIIASYATIIWGGLCFAIYVWKNKNEGRNGYTEYRET